MQYEICKLICPAQLTSIVIACSFFSIPIEHLQQAIVSLPNWNMFSKVFHIVHSLRYPKLKTREIKMPRITTREEAAKIIIMMAKKQQQQQQNKQKQNKNCDYDCDTKMAALALKTGTHTHTQTHSPTDNFPLVIHWEK